MLAAPATAAPAHALQSGGTNWVNVTNGVAPAPRAGAGTTFDPALGGVLVFGGCTSGDYEAVTCAPVADTWLYAAGHWKQLVTAHIPPARYRPGMTFDYADNYVLLFGGFGPGGLPDVLGDTWAFNGVDWTQLLPGTAPGARAGPALTYDYADHYVVLFGGYNSTASTTRNDTWTFASGVWTPLTPLTSPPPRYDAAFDFDNQTGSAILFAGYTTGYDSVPASSLSDTWSFRSGQWVALAPSTAPPPRNEAGVAYVPYLSGLLIFQGHAGYNFWDDEWLFSGGAWTQISPTAFPSARWGSAMAYDPAGNTTLVFGGFILTGPYPPSTNAYFNDTWELLPPRSLNFYSVLTTVIPAVCGPVILGGISVSSGTSFGTNSSSVTAAAPACSGYTFSAWTFTGQLSLSNRTAPVIEVGLVGNGTLTALYTALNGSGGGTNAGYWPYVTAAVGALAAGLAVGLVLALRRRAPRVPPPGASPPLHP